MTTDERIAAFFAPPVPLQEGPNVSVLHLLRREIQDCLIGEVVPEDEVLSRPARHRLFATAMLLVAGVDLLAKLYEGADNVGGAGRRFKAFAKRFVFAGLANPELLAEVLWVGCRNPLLHSFSVHNQTYNMVVLVRTEFAPPDKFEPAVVGAPDNRTFILSVDGLFEAFLRTIATYRKLLETDSDLRRNFDSLFPKYGQLAVETVHLEKTDTGFTLSPG